VRAQSGNGTWGPANHYLFEVDNTLPVLSNPSPPATVPLTQTSQTQAIVHVSDADGVDLESLLFTVNGTTYTVSAGGVHFDAPTGNLTISLPTLRPQPVIHDGDVVTVSIVELSDMAGNEIPQPFTWSWQASFSNVNGNQFAPATFNGGQDPAWSSDSQRLAFSSNRSGSYNLYVLTAQGNNVLEESTATLTQLTNLSANLTQPAWSPDGRTLAFVSDATGAKQIWMMPADASGPAVQLTTGGQDDEHPLWSPDGAHILFSRSDQGLGNLWSVDLSTPAMVKTGEHQVTQDDIGYDLEPRYSSNGQSITYRRSLYVDNINTVHPDGTAVASLTSSGKEFTPAYSSDGTLIVFASARTGAVPGLWTMDPQGQGQAPLLDNLGIYTEKDPAWSPDGFRIAFTSTRSGSPNVWMLSLLRVSSFTAVPAMFSPGGTSPTAKKTITFSWQLSAAGASVSLDILSGGNFVRNLLAGDLESSGPHTLTWNGQNAGSQPVQNGTYTARLTVTGQAAISPLISQASFFVDNVAPTVNLQASSGNAALGYFNPGTVFSITAQGIPYAMFQTVPIQEIDLAVDTTNQFQVSPGTFSLAAGPHVLAMRALDIAGNLSAPVLQTANIDDQPPISTMTYVGAAFPTDGGIVYVSSSTRFVVNAVDSSSSVIVSGIASIQATQDAVVVSSPSGPLAMNSFGLAAGTHTITFAAQDQGGNLEDIHIVPAFVDITPPAAAYSANPPLFFNGVRFFASSSTVFGLSAQDPFSNGGASGVSQILLSTDGGSFAAYSSSWSFSAGGTHNFQFMAVDNVENVSGLQSVFVTVTNNPPTAVLLVSTPSYVAGNPISGTTNYASAQTRFSLAVASGAAAADYFQMNVDQTGFAVFTSTSVLTISSEGVHSLQFDAVRGGVSEAPDTYSVVVDTTPPQTQLTFDFVYFSTAATGPACPSPAVLPGAGPGCQPIVSSNTVITLKAFDALSGPASTYCVLDGNLYLYTGPFRLGAYGLVSGSHSFSWFSNDNVANQEIGNNTSVIVANSPPTTSVQTVGGIQASISTITYASGDTAFAVSANDPFGVPIARIMVTTRTGSGFQVYAGTMTFAEGPRTIQSYAINSLGLVGPVSTYNVVVDTEAPSVSATFTGPFRVANGITYGTLATIFNVIPGPDPSGVAAVEVYADSAPVIPPFSFFAEGLHTMTADAVDRVGNRTNPPLTLSVIIDQTPPASALAVNVAVVSTATVSLSTGDVLSISATDYYAGNRAPGVGVKESHVSWDGGPDHVLTGTFALGIGTHTVSF
jgi:Tol biopolymer transport system component